MTTTLTTPAIFSLYSTSTTLTTSNSNQFRPNFFTPNSNPRLRISRSISTSSSSSRPFDRVPCCCHNAGINPESTNDSTKESSIDIQLPRRSLLVHFTCDACGERTKRLINRLAYERGTVFVQCSGCLQHHRLVDNLGLVVEYDFRNSSDEDKKPR